MMINDASEHRDSTTLVLQIVVANHCLQCRDAVGLADQIRKEFPRLDVHVLDLDVPGTIKPHAVFAVPSYLLNGRIIWLGNPEPAELRATLQKAAQSLISRASNEKGYEQCNSAA